MGGEDIKANQILLIAKALLSEPRHLTYGTFLILSIFITLYYFRISTLIKLFTVLLLQRSLVFHRTLFTI